MSKRRSSFSFVVPSEIGMEFELAELGNRLRTCRAGWLAERWVRSPSQSFPKLAGSDGNLEAIYRFMESAHFDYRPLVESHVVKTVGRVEEAGGAILIHDTTDCEPASTQAEGMGRLSGSSGRGLLMHVSLAIADDQSRRPLGLMGLHAWARTNAKKSRYNESGRKLTGADYAKREDRESEKWQQAVADSGARLDRKRIVHVMDREADAYPLMSWMVDEGHAFVIRTSRDRIASAEISVGEKDHLNAVLTVAPVLTTRDVALSKRRASTTPRVTATFGERKQRSAHLELRALPVVLKRPHYLGPMEWMTVNVVHVTEKDPPAGEPAVEWTLLTSLPIETVSDVERIVDTYRIRWMIEEYFKALKTGCAIEKRQLESFDAMMKAIAIAAPVAWHLLLLRYVAHVEPKATAAKVLSPTQIAVLRAQGALKSDRPSAADALSAVASLGGHIKNNGRPGWHTLGHGYATLLLLEQGWLAAISRAKLDQ